MKDYKNTSGTKILLLFSPAFYTLLPPLLTAAVFNRFNLNPFAIVKFLHFNPFLADRGIPGYQTFFYLLMLWLGMNILLWLLVWGWGGCIGAGERRAADIFPKGKRCAGNDFTINNETYYHLFAGEGKGCLLLCPRAGTTLLTLLPVFMPALRWRFYPRQNPRRRRPSLFISMAV